MYYKIWLLYLLAFRWMIKKYEMYHCSLKIYTLIMIYFFNILQKISFKMSTSQEIDTLAKISEVLETLREITKRLDKNEKKTLIDKISNIIYQNPSGNLLCCQVWLGCNLMLKEYYSRVPNKRPGTANYFEKIFHPISLYLAFKTGYF